MGNNRNVPLSSSSAAVGHSVTVHGTYNDTVGDHRPQTWTVSWGDGTTSERDNDNSTTESFVHAYATAGTYDPIVSVAAFALTGSASGTASAISVHNPTLSIAGGTGTATENGQVPDHFTISRSDGTAFPLTVGYTLGGTATSLTSEYIVTDDASGKVLSSGTLLTGTATIPAGVLSEVLDVTPLEDHVPRWTDTLDVTLTSGSGYSLSAGATMAQTEILNNDLFLRLGDGSDNIIMDGSDDGSTGLISLVYSFPAEAKAGTEVTLRIDDSGDTLVNVWTTSSPSDTDTPILGDVNGTYVGSVTWTYGSGTDEPPANQTFWVGGGTGASSDIGDIHFTGSDSDPDPCEVDTPPSNSGTKLRLIILPNNNPNGSDPENWADHKIPWLVGQLVDINAELVGVGSMVDDLQLNYQWHIPAADNVLEKYTISSDHRSATTLSVANDDGGSPYLGGPGGSATHTGLQKEQLEFFWVTAPSGPSTISVDVSEATEGEPMLFGGTLSASTQFTVYSPTVSDQSLAVGPAVTTADPVVVAEHPGERLTGLLTGVSDPNGHSWGMVAQAKVQEPAGYGFRAGKFDFVQRISTTATRTESVGGITTNSHYNTAPSVKYLDTYWPGGNPRGPLPNYTEDKSVGVDTYTGPGWATGSTLHYAVDEPDLTVEKYYIKYAFADDFDTYIGFVPDGPDSQWVPLQVATWKFSVSAKLELHAWWLQVTQPTSTAFTAAAAEPKWTGLYPFDFTWVSP